MKIAWQYSIFNIPWQYSCEYWHWKLHGNIQYSVFNGNIHVEIDIENCMAIFNGNMHVKIAWQYSCENWHWKLHQSGESPIFGWNSPTMGSPTQPQRPCCEKQCLTAPVESGHFTRKEHAESQENSDASNRRKSKMSPNLNKPIRSSRKAKKGRNTDGSQTKH